MATHAFRIEMRLEGLHHVTIMSGDAWERTTRLNYAAARTNPPSGGVAGSTIASAFSGDLSPVGAARLRSLHGRGFRCRVCPDQDRASSSSAPPSKRVLKSTVLERGSRPRIGVGRQLRRSTIVHSPDPGASLSRSFREVTAGSEGRRRWIGWYSRASADQN
jgi:hypothetical protein